MRPALVAVCAAALGLAAPASGQPVAPPPLPTADAALRAALDLAAPERPPADGEAADGEAPPALYWTGVALDAAALAGGTYLLVQGVRLYRLADAASGEGDVTLGLGPMLAALTGIGALTVGGGAVAVAGYDLVRVLRGDDPWLARLVDPTRLPPGGGPPRFPPPPRPPY